MFSILIVDPITLLRCGLKHVLKDELGTTTVGEAPDVDVAREHFRKRRWEVVVLGIPKVELNFQLIGEVKEAVPSSKIMLMGLARDRQTAMRAVHAGASGYLCRDASLAEVVRAFRRILAGKHYISERIDVISTAAVPHTKLSTREHLVLTGIAEGKPIRVIAGDLGLDIRTVSTYRRRALEKMSMRSNADLIRYVTQHGLENAANS